MINVFLNISSEVFFSIANWSLDTASCKESRIRSTFYTCTAVPEFEMKQEFVWIANKIALLDTQIERSD